MRWQHVTRALMKKDVEKATEEKHAVSPITPSVAVNDWPLAFT